MSHDRGRGMDAMGVTAGLPLGESGRGTTVWRVDRFDPDQVAWAKRLLGARAEPTGPQMLARGIRPYSTTETVGNVITTAGWTRMLNLLTAQGAVQALDAAHTRIGVGNGVTAATAADTDLAAAAGSTNRWFQLATGVGTVGGTVPKTLVIVASFASADGNFTWAEFGVDQGTASGNTVTAALINRALSAQGTKTAGQVWTATAMLSFT